MREPEQPVWPLFVGDRNCQHITNRPWRAVQALMHRHGVEPLSHGPRTRMYRAADVLRVFELEAAAQQPSAPLSEEQEAEQLLRELGLEVRQ